MIEEKIEILNKFYWSNKEIKRYFGLTDSIVKRIKKQIVLKNKLNKNIRRIRMVDVFEVLNIDYTEELESLLIAMKMVGDKDEWNR